jgi:archaellum biogenesis ATPase FlaH
MPAKLDNTKLEVQSLISLLDSDVEIVRLELESTLREAHFISGSPTQTAFRRIRRLLGQNNYPTWTAILADPAIPKEDRDRLSALSSNNRRVFVTRKEAQHAVKTLDDYRKTYGLFDRLKAASDILNDDTKEFDVNEVISTVAKGLEEIMRAERTSDHDDHISDIDVKNLIEDLRKGNKHRVIPTGIEEFDRVNGGVIRGTHMIIGADSSGGKSQLAQCVAMNMAREGKKVCFASLEMNKQMVWTRSLAYLTGFSYDQLEQRKITDVQYDWALDCYYVFKESIRRSGGCFRVIADISATMEELLSSLAPYNYDVIVIDYLSLLEGNNNTDFWMRLGEASNKAQSFAVRNDNAVISVCQAKEDGTLRLSEQVKASAGLMWVWETSKMTKDKAKGERDQPGKSEFAKLGIDFIEVMMPKSRMQKPFLMRLYRSTAHTQVASNVKDLQKPWIHKFPQASDIFKQRPWENGVQESEAKQKELEESRKQRRKRMHERVRTLVIEGTTRELSDEEIKRMRARQLRHRHPGFSFSNDNESEEEEYYEDENLVKPTYRQRRRS